MCPYPCLRIDEHNVNRRDSNNLVTSPVREINKKKIQAGLLPIVSRSWYICIHIEPHAVRCVRGRSERWEPRSSAQNRFPCRIKAEARRRTTTERRSNGAMERRSDGSHRALRRSAPLDGCARDLGSRASRCHGDVRITVSFVRARAPCRRQRASKTMQAVPKTERETSEAERRGKLKKSTRKK